MKELGLEDLGWKERIGVGIGVVSALIVVKNFVKVVRIGTKYRWIS